MLAASVIEPVRMIKEQHFGTCRADFLIRFRNVDQPSKEIGGYNRVIVEQKNLIRPAAERVTHSHIASAGEPQVGSIPDHPDLRRIFQKLFRGAIDRTVVHQDNFKV